MPHSSCGGIDTLATFAQLALMSAVIATPVEWLESVANLRFSKKADELLQTLMDQNMEGNLNESQRDDLEGLAELSEQLSLVRTEALRILKKSRE